MLVIKDLYSDISDCFWLFYGSKYNILSWTHYRKTGRFIVGIIVIVSYFILICSLCGYSQSAIDKTGRTGTIIDTLHNESKSELQQIKPVQ